MYKIKVTDFDVQTKVKQATVREILWEDFETSGKPNIYERNVVEIFGETQEQLREAFMNNGISRNVLEHYEEGKAPEIVVEIGENQIFEYSQFKNINFIERMIAKHHYKLKELIGCKGAMIVIQNPTKRLEHYPNFYLSLKEELCSEVRVFVFLTCASEPQFLTHFGNRKLGESSFDFVVETWRRWGVETYLLERLYRCLRFNIMI